MKLLTKINIRYIIWSLTVMVFSGVAIYFILSAILNRQMDEQLAGSLLRVEKQLKSNPRGKFLDPFIEIVPTTKKNERWAVSDTVIYNMEENEPEEYRQLMTIKEIDGEYFQITILKSKIESEDLLETLALVTVVAMLLLTAILIVVNRKVAQSVWKDFYLNLEKMKDFSLQKQEKLELHQTDIREFSELNRIIENLTAKVISVYRNQKQFSEDVSHELQTPLAIITSRIETLLNDDELNARHSEIIKSIYTSVRRLSRLNKELILLSKIENNQFPTTEQSNLNQIIRDKLDEFAEVIELKKLSLEAKLENVLMVSLPPILGEILINNLLSNSINHNIKEGKISIETQSGKLIFSNSGTNELKESDKIFNRFYKADPSSGSVGLGLAIVKKICDLHHVGIQYYFNQNTHNFMLTFQL